jgi:hypothetical protein
MRFREFSEAVDPAQDQSMNTNPTASGTSTTPSQNTQMNTQQAAQVKTSLNNLKDVLGQAGGGNIDVNKLTQIMAQQSDPSKPMNPTMVKALQGMLPGLADAMQNQQSANMIKQGLKTGMQAQADAQQQTQQPETPK